MSVVAHGPLVCDLWLVAFRWTMPEVASTWISWKHRQKCSITFSTSMFARHSFWHRCVLPTLRKHKVTMEEKHTNVICPESLSAHCIPTMFLCYRLCSECLQHLRPTIGGFVGLKTTIYHQNSTILTRFYIF